MYSSICTFDNLHSAYCKASRGKRGRSEVATFEQGLEKNLLSLQRNLKNGSYRPGAYRNFHIHEPKHRLISAAPFQDRVVHHALCNVIEPVFERSFIRDSYANRIGKGTHRALDRAQQFARRYPYVLQCDIKQFFPSIDHLLLRQIIGKKIRDQQVLDLVALILDGGRDVLKDEYRMVYFSGDDLFAAARSRGLPIGNLTSQFWGNVYLNGLDHFIKRELRCGGYVRYVDDFLLFAEEKRTLWDWYGKLVARLEGLRLVMHQGTHTRPVTEGIPFLGFVIYPDHRKLKRRKGLYFQRKYHRMLKAFHAGEIPLAKVSSSVQGWVNHVRYGNTVGLRKRILGGPPR